MLGYWLMLSVLFWVLYFERHPVKPGERRKWLPAFKLYGLCALTAATVGTALMWLVTWLLGVDMQATGVHPHVELAQAIYAMCQGMVGGVAFMVVDEVATEDVRK